MVNQHQCVEILKRPEIELYHRDAPYYRDNWRPLPGLTDVVAESAVQAIPPLPGDVPADAVLRMSFPYNFAPSPCPRLFVFGTAEHRAVPKHYVAGQKSLAQAVLDNPAAQIITPSNWSREGYIHSGAPAERVHVVPHGVDVNVYHPLSEQQRQALRPKAQWSGFVFLHVGAMTGNKGVVPLLKATAAVIAKRPQVMLMLKGIDVMYNSRLNLDEYMKALTEAEKHLLLPRLQYNGKIFSVRDIATMHQLADAYISPYQSEGFNLPVLEAAATGSLVLCTKGGSTDDFTRPEFALGLPAKLENTLVNDQTGKHLLVDRDAMIEQMMRAVDEPQLRERAREEGPKFARENFTWKHVTDRLLKTIFPELYPAGG